MSYWYEQLTKIKGNEQCLQWLENELNIFANSALLGNREFLDDWDFLNSNDLSVEDFWMVLYFQTLPYGKVIFKLFFNEIQFLMASLGSLALFSSLETSFDDLLFGIQRYF
ncbi:unnamed protein product [Rhizophagus irregularis]|nr:unnamed protein product [Rhizophagus irregularis]